MDFLIEDLINLYAQSEFYQNKELDFGPESLTSVEQFFLDFLDDKIKLDRSTEAMVVRLAYYYGEVVVRNIGGKWVQSEHDDNSFGNPIIEGYSKTPNVFQDPLTLCWTLSERKRQGILSRAFRNAVQWAAK
jgi:hypothetical protein